MKDYVVVVRVLVPECEDSQEAINYISENIGLSEFNLEIDIEGEHCENNLESEEKDND